MHTYIHIYYTYTVKGNISLKISPISEAAISL